MSSLLDSDPDTDNRDRDGSAFSRSNSHSSLREPLLSVDLGSSSSIHDDHNRNTNANNAMTPVSQTKKEPKSKNINLILLYTFIAFCSRSLWNQSVLSAFVYLLQTDDPKYVGFITAIMGLAQLLTSFPAGYFADKYRRDSVLRISSFVGIVAATCTFIAASVEVFWVLAVALALWGVFWGVGSTSVAAMFADSIPDGDRSLYFTRRKILQLLGNTVGPSVAYIMFTTFGNVWTTEECARVIQAGQVISIPALILLNFMNDDYRLEDIREEDPDREGDLENSTSTVSERRDALVTDNDVEGTMNTPLISNDDEISTASLLSSLQTSNFLCVPGERVVPVFVVTADVLGGLAAGMSVRYFPIFFLENLQMRPDQVQIVFIITMLSMACVTHIVQRVSTKVGRLETTLFLKFSGVTMFFAMISAFQHRRSYKVVCGLYVIRTALMNGPSALTRSVIMDHVPTEERAKWSSLESVNMFSWAGSAALGGILVDAKGILFNFRATAIFQAIATFPLILAIMFGTEKNEDELGSRSESETEDETDIDEENDGGNGNDNGNGNENDSDTE